MKNILATFLCISAFLRYGVTGSLEDDPEIPEDVRNGQSPGVHYPLMLTPLPDSDTKQHYDYSDLPSSDTGYRPRPPYPIGNRKRCPLCDSSVYPYCSEKLLHDACCCSYPHVYDLPYQCKLADCRFLHANSCNEHRLIANCCCTDDYRSLLKSLSEPFPLSKSKDEVNSAEISRAPDPSTRDRV